MGKLNIMVVFGTRPEAINGAVNSWVEKNIKKPLILLQ